MTLAQLERQAVRLDRRLAVDELERQAVRLDRRLAVDEHLALLDKLAEIGGQSWDAHGDILDQAGLPARVRENALRSREARLLGLGSPKAAYGPFRQMYDGAIALADQTAVTGTSETALYPSGQYTGFVANQLRAGQIWQLILFGIGTTPGASQGNITLTPRFGTTTSGTSLGASTATALVASATNKLWQLEMYLIVRSVGLAGANSNVVASGIFSCDVALIAAATGNSIPFGSTANVAVDLSISAGLFIGITLGSASDSFKTLGVILESLN